MLPVIRPGAADSQFGRFGASLLPTAFFKFPTIHAHLLLAEIDLLKGVSSGEWMYKIKIMDLLDLIDLLDFSNKNHAPNGRFGSNRASRTRELPCWSS
jgi:hypothetical protein